MAAKISGKFKFVSQENHAAFLKAMGAPDEMVDKVVGNLDKVN